MLTQFENNPDVVQYVTKKGKEKGMTVIVNPAPVNIFDESYFKYIDYLVPNEHELEQLTGTFDIKEGCKRLLSKGVKNVIVTLGEKGSMLINQNETISVAPYKVHAIDTTAAGDSYLGALAFKLSNNAPIEEAMKFASLASSKTVTKKGAIISIPHKADFY